MSGAVGASALELTETDIRRKPWKYIGYRGYADFISSDEDFLILRRFDALNARVALGLQDEIMVLEEGLSKLDAAHSKREAKDLNNGTIRNDVLADRTDLLDLIAKKIRRYNGFLLQQSDLKKLPQAPQHDIKSLRNWHFNHDYAAISREEQEYLEKADLVRAVAKEKTPLRRAIDSSLRLRTLAVWKSRKQNVPDYDANYVSYYSDKRIDGSLSAVIVFTGVTMLITPIWILQALHSLKTKLGVITVFVFMFLLLVSFAMVSKPFEALGATAAYAAVLMVFIQFGTAST